MLLQFKFKNFKSFRDDTVLDMTATKSPEFGDSVINIANNKVLPVAAIYGANASGKTNIYEAFFFMCYYVIKSFNFGGEGDKREKRNTYRKPTPFLLDNAHAQSESTFEVFFIDNSGKYSIEYNYGFSINQECVCEEWLNYATKSSRGAFSPIFYRKGSELEMSGIYDKHYENIKIALQKETLVVSLGAKLKDAKLTSVWEWFVRNECVNFGQPAENFLLSKILPDGFEDDESVQNDVVKFFSSFDESITKFIVEKSLNEQDGHDNKDVRVYAVHKMNDSDKTVRFPLRYESSGTLKMFALYQFLQNVLEQGSVLFIDELNSKLHPLLVRTLVQCFTNPESNPNHAQLIYTTHDAWQLNNHSLRRDEIWFAEKGDDGASVLFALSDFADEDGKKIRNDENYEKNYLLGKYGAIPLMKQFSVPLDGDLQ